MNVYGTNRGGWLITPPIQMPGPGYQLELDIGLTDYGNYAAPDAPTDDRFIILIGDGSSWTPANVVREWNNTGSAYVYDNIPYTGEHVLIPLDSYSGIKHIAFYGESTVSGGDNDLFVDNVQICQTPASAVFTIAPALTNWDFGLLPAGSIAEKEFAVSNSGGGNLIVSSITQTGTNPPFSIVPTPDLPWSLTNADLPNTFKVVFSPQTAGGPFSTDVTVTCNDGTQATYTVSFTGSAYAPATLPLTEGWENGQGTWIIVNGTQANKWHIGAGDATYGPYEGSNFAYISNDNGNTVAYSNTASVTHIYQDIVFDDDCFEFPFSFQWRCRGEGTTTTYDRMKVYLVDPSITPVAGIELTTGQVGSDYNQQTNWTAETITLPGRLSGTVKRLVFSWRNDGSVEYQPPANIDNISLTAVPIPSGPVAAPNLDYPADRQTGLPKTGFPFQFSWNTAGSEPERYDLWIAKVSDLTITPYDSDEFFNVAVEFPNVTSPYQPAFTYDYSEVYVWTVLGSRGTDPVQFQWPPYEFTIEPDPTITNFPWNEDFEDGIFPPVGWTVADVDAAGTYWTASNSQNHTTGGNTSAVHSYSTAVPAPGQDGWLITPPAAIPTSTYNVVLSWWNYNVYPTWLVYNGVKVNTTNDPVDPNWIELWSQDSAASAWSNEVVNINAYQGQTVYFAFHYQGYNADDWFVDDVSIYELIVDLIPPTITHLPVINTPREDLQQMVVADIRDDATWNNLIGGANLYYSIDGGTTYSAAVNMVAYDDTTYYAYIPAQPLGTTVTYYMEAWDSENNMATTDEFSYGVNDPTWIWYDTGGTTYLGYTATDYGPTVLFENPFYGTGNAMQLLATDGSSYYGNAANLQIWTYDGVNDLVPYFATPIPVTFGAQTYDTFDLSTYNVQITDPYFFVSYLDVPMGNYILFDTTYDYGTSFVFQGTTLYMMGNAGSWSIGARVQTGISLGLDAPVVTIALTAGQPTLSWDAVTGANSYLVYGATDPYAADPWTLLDTVYTPGYTYTGTAAMEFFKVTASDIAAPARGSEQATPLKKTQTFNAPKIRLDNAPKGIIKTGLSK